jgi:hypothetical protein
MQKIYFHEIPLKINKDLKTILLSYKLLHEKIMGK